MEKVTCEAPGLVSHHMSYVVFKATLVFDQQLGKVTENCLFCLTCYNSASGPSHLFETLSV